jgi:hypothetical protein
MAVVERAKLQFICWYFKVKKAQDEKEKLAKEALEAAQAKRNKQGEKVPWNVSYVTSKDNTNNLISYIFITAIIFVLSVSVCLEIRRRRLLSENEEVIDAEFIDYSSDARRSRVMHSIMGTFTKINYEDYQSSFKNESDIVEVQDVKLDVQPTEDSCNFEDDHEETDSPNKKASLNPDLQQTEFQSPEPK